MADPTTLYKLIVLYMLERIDSPMSNAQISDFFLGKDYTDYFTTQQVLHNLLDSYLIRSESTHNATQYSLTPLGKETLRLFEDKISDSITDDVTNYLSANDLAIKDANSLIANYYRAGEHEYVAECQLRKNERKTLEITLHVQTEEQADAICTNWAEAVNDIYANLMDSLLK